MEQYKDLVQYVMENGYEKENRTGINTKAIVGYMFEHDLDDGFPLLTTKYVPFSLVKSELEFFIKGLDDKKWLQERNNHIWDNWCSPLKVRYGNDEETKKKMLHEPFLGPIYGCQWRRFGEWQNEFEKFDQLKYVIEKLKTDPNDRRLIVSAWNPNDLQRMALPPCHYAFQLLYTGGRLNLIWIQRSVDVALGLPFDIASYAMLLCLICMEVDMVPGKLIGQLGDVHIYENHYEKLKEQLQRDCLPLPVIETRDFVSVNDWEFTDTTVKNYKHAPAINFKIAV